MPLSNKEKGKDMSDINYRILALIKKADDKNKTITYQEIISILTQDKIKILDIRDSVIELINESFLECQSNNNLDMISPLILTKYGKKAYKKEYCARNPEKENRVKRAIRNLWKDSLLGLRAKTVNLIVQIMIDVIAILALIIILLLS